MRIKVEKMNDKFKTQIILKMKDYSFVKTLCEDRGDFVEAIDYIRNLNLTYLNTGTKIGLKDIENAVKHLAGVLQESDFVILESQELAITGVMLKLNKINILIESHGSVHIDSMHLNIDALKEIIRIYESNF